MQRPTAAPLSRPPAGIDLARGAAIFANDQGCAPCRGRKGAAMAKSPPTHVEIPDLNDAPGAIRSSLVPSYLDKTEQPGCVM
jgi:hypothetical protein